MEIKIVFLSELNTPSDPAAGHGLIKQQIVGGANPSVGSRTRSTNIDSGNNNTYNNVIT